MTDKKLRVVIVGAGFAGLTAAIECQLRGMQAILVEAYPGPTSHGDLLDFTENAGRIFKSWDNGRVGRAIFESGVTAAKTMQFYNQENVLLRVDAWPHGDQVYAGHRGTMHRIVFDYAVEVGVEMRCGKRVLQYLDTEDECGVTIDGGDKILGDVLIAADGPRSLARSQLLKLPEGRVNSGYAIFRAYFEVSDSFKSNPALEELAKEDEDVVRFWVGRDMHGFIYTWNKGRDCAWVLTHLDDANIGESWSFPGKKEDVHSYLTQAGFPNVWHEIVELTPESRLIDYKLVWRDPLKTWVTSSKRGVVIGDAAHCHLPTSAQGACMAVEDAATIAICLQKSNGNVPLALQVFERIRFNRSHTIHQASIFTRNIYHKNDWSLETVQQNPDSLVMPLMDWILDFDAKKTAEDNFEQLASDVKSGREGSIEELALPAGGDYNAMNISATDQFISSTGRDHHVQLSSVAAATQALPLKI
ncbi:salicylate hydroxylase [Cucurbitaria berberidis CBS 394.84]|uniref:Salicylate hydroxylase n=1 Tax=Cucurbitaria berberidis CBS 394.84 TaxID=1168544 RepID=A0A9P4G8X4_9PLEO|nr:salicylate hydroxylase [Cucurbitaria berberidis CBS 394.84]KAF1841293.1 salicylate hydroxylase [Cucurbitaria berberidis CBS 394.84]